MRHAFHHLASALALAVLLGAASAGQAGAGAPVSTTPIANALSASLLFAGGNGEMPVWTNIRVSIKRNGVQVVSAEPLPAGSTASYGAAPKLVTADFDGDADPEVAIDIVTAGFDCCARTVIYHHVGTGYAATVQDWPQSGYVLRDVFNDKVPEFVTVDPRIPALFKSTAAGPLRILAFDQGEMNDATARAKSLVARDARTQKRAIKTAPGGDARAAVAGYVVDLLRLRKTKQARAAITSAAKHHQLHGTSAQKFAHGLDVRLVRWGYFRIKPLGRI